MSNKNLPQGWASTRLGDLYNFEYGKSLIKSARAESGTYPVYGSSGVVGMHDQFIVEGPAIIVGRKGAAGSVSYSPDNCWPIDTTYYVQSNKNLCLKFSYYLLKSLNLGKLEASTAIPGLNRAHAYDEAVLLPPLPEQHRIVAKIEELFSELDKGIESLKTAREQLKVYRQALLKHAFEGKLTAQWRAENRDKLESADALLARIQAEREQRYRQQLQQWEAAGKSGSKPKAPKSLPPLTAEELAELPKLPTGWEWEKLGNIADLIGGVTKGKNLDGKKTVSLPYLRVANVQDGYLDLSDIKYIEVEEQDKNKYRLEYGDVLYTEGGDKDKLGRGAVWHSQIESCIHQNHIFRARVFGGLISPEILSLYSQTKSAKRYFFRHAKQTTNLASINLTVLANLPVAIFCRAEQEQISLEMDTCFSEADQLDQTITTSLQQAEALRQSILKKAFSGQLVPQDPNDEPASVLLARIAAEKASKQQSTKTAKTKK